MYIENYVYEVVGGRFFMGQCKFGVGIRHTDPLCMPDPVFQCMPQFPPFASHETT